MRNKKNAEEKIWGWFQLDHWIEKHGMELIG